jgi:hypothetical protein
MKTRNVVSKVLWFAVLFSGGMHSDWAQAEDDTASKISQVCAALDTPKMGSSEQRDELHKYCASFGRDQLNQMYEADAKKTIGGNSSPSPTPAPPKMPLASCESAYANAIGVCAVLPPPARILCTQAAGAAYYLCLTTPMPMPPTLPTLPPPPPPLPFPTRANPSPGQKPSPSPTVTPPSPTTPTSTPTTAPKPSPTPVTPPVPPITPAQCERAFLAASAACTLLPVGAFQACMQVARSGYEQCMLLVAASTPPAKPVPNQSPTPIRSKSKT